MSEKADALRKRINERQEELNRRYTENAQTEAEIEAMRSELYQLEDAEFWEEYPGIKMLEGSKWETNDGIVLEVMSVLDYEEGAYVYFSLEPMPLEKARTLKLVSEAEQANS